MSRLKHVIHEIHRRSLWQVLGIYIAASWIALQVVGQLQESLDLPTWVSGAAIIVLIVGLPIVLATAFVQEHGAPREAPSGAGPTPEAPATDGTTARDVRPAAAPPAGLAPAVPIHRKLLSWRNAALGGAAAFLLLFGIAGLYVVIQDRGRAFGPDEAVAEEAAPGIAVLPFNVSGPGTEFWREGLAQALALNLDGLAGLRTIDSRTVLSRWEDRIGERASPDLNDALGVARAAGGRYALLGDLVSTGARLQAALAVYDLETGERLDRVQVDGAAAEDSTFALVNRLTLEAVRVLPRAAEGEGAPAVDLARITTDSIAALRAFLEGEAYFRDEDYSPAIDAFARAVDIDSTFALAHYRLSLAYGWRDYASGRDGHDAKAVQFSDRLSERSRLLVRAHLAYSEGRAYDAYGQLEEVTRKYPDEIEGWYLLGETVYHLGDELLRDPATSSRAFERVAEIDPTFMPGQEHRVETAFAAGDSAGVRRLLALDWGDAPQIPAYRISERLAWGSDAERRAALASLDGMPAESVYWAGVVLAHPDQVGVQETVLTRAFAPGSDIARAPTAQIANHLRQGKTSAVEAQLSSPPLSPAQFILMSLAARFAGYGIDGERLDRALASAEEAGRGSYLALALAALSDLGRAADVDELRAGMQALADSLREAGEGVASVVEGYRRLADGYILARRGGPGAGADSLVAALRAATGWTTSAIVNGVGRWWAAEALREAGRPAEAEPYYLSLYREPNGGPLQAVAAERLGQLYDAQGDLERAAAYYAVFTEMWKDADPELQPRVEAARARLQEIIAERG